MAGSKSNSSRINSPETPRVRFRRVQNVLNFRGERTVRYQSGYASQFRTGEEIKGGEWSGRCAWAGVGPDALLNDALYRLGGCTARRRPAPVARVQCMPPADATAANVAFTFAPPRTQPIHRSTRLFLLPASGTQSLAIREATSDSEKQTRPRFIMFKREPKRFDGRNGR